MRRVLLVLATLAGQIVSGRCAQAVDQPTAPDSFSKGLEARGHYERFYGVLSPGEQAGASFWATERSKPHPGSCQRDNDVEFTRGCLSAKAMLADPDVLRRSDAVYRSGWNSYQPSHPQASLPAMPTAAPAAESNDLPKLTSDNGSTTSGQDAAERSAPSTMHWVSRMSGPRDDDKPCDTLDTARLLKFVSEQKNIKLARIVGSDAMYCMNDAIMCHQSKSPIMSLKLEKWPTMHDACVVTLAFLDTSNHESLGMVEVHVDELRDVRMMTDGAP